MDTTTIQIKEETLGRLKYFKEYTKESYDEILNKVLDTLEEGELTDKDSFGGTTFGSGLLYASFLLHLYGLRKNYKQSA